MKQFILKKTEKNGKTYYYLLLKITYASGKSFIELVTFLTASEYDQLSNEKKIDIICF